MEPETQLLEVSDCHDESGREMACAGSGHDGAFRAGVEWPEPRFEAGDRVVVDRLTGLIWARDANLAGWPMFWDEALEFVAAMNRDGALGLASGHPFLNVRDSYWSSTTSAFEPDWAWALYLEKGAVGVGGKGGRHFFVWAVSTRQRPLL